MQTAVNGMMLGSAFLVTSHLMMLIVKLVIYFINGLGFYKIGKIRGVQAPWLAFIPVFNLYTIGVIGDSLKYENQTINRYFERVNLALVLPLAFLLFDVFTFGFFSKIGDLLLFAANLMVCYLVYEFYDDEHKILFTVLSIVPILTPFLMLYVTRNIKINNY